MKKLIIPFVFVLLGTVSFSQTQSKDVSLPENTFQIVYSARSNNQGQQVYISPTQFEEMAKLRRADGPVYAHVAEGTIVKILPIGATVSQAEHVAYFNEMDINDEQNMIARKNLVDIRNK